jgi:hypothetical protein
VRSVSVDFAAVMIITLVAITAPAFLHDDAVFFNYVNNVDRPHPLYYYAGYVHVIPQAVSWMLQPLPLVMQAVMYRLVPFALALLLYRETARLLAARRPGDEASMIALGIVLVLRTVEDNLWANLSFASWLALLISIAFVIRVRLESGTYSWFAFCGLLIVAVAFPPGLLLVLLFVANGATTASLRIRIQNLALAVITVAAHAWVASGSPIPTLNTGFLDAPWMFVDAFRERKLHNLVVIASLVTLPVMLAWWTRRARSLSQDVVVIASACAIGVGAAAVYVMSSRFLHYYGAFEPRYAVTPAFCAMLAVAWTVLADRAPQRRSMSVGIFTGIAVTVVIAAIFGTLRGPLEFALMKYRFLGVASEARLNCPPDEVFVFEDEAGSPFVFCTPRSLPPGADYRLNGFAPSVGVSAPDDAIDDRPFLLNPRPFP